MTMIINKKPVTICKMSVNKAEFIKKLNRLKPRTTVYGNEYLDFDIIINTKTDSRLNDCIILESLKPQDYGKPNRIEIARFRTLEMNKIYNKQIQEYNSAVNNNKEFMKNNYFKNKQIEEESNKILSKKDYI